MNAYRGKHVSPASRHSSRSLRRGRHQARNHRSRRWLFLLAVLVLVVLAYPFLEARLIQTEVKQLKSPDLPLEANNLRIVYLSDIHYGFWFSDGDVSRLVSRINNLRPDLVLFGGDYGADNQSSIRFFQALQKQDKIHSRYGIYGVIGDMDRGDSDFTYTQVTESMMNAGVTPLVNKALPLNIATRRIWLAGVDDVLTEWRSFIAEEKERQLTQIIQEEKLNEEATRKFIADSLRNGEVKTTGTDIDKLMPPTSRFGGGNRAAKKQTIIEKLKAFFERFFGIG